MLGRDFNSRGMERCKGFDSSFLAFFCLCARRPLSSHWTFIMPCCVKAFALVLLHDIISPWTAWGTMGKKTRASSTGKYRHQRCSGGVHRCHRCDLCSIPGWCTFTCAWYCSRNQFQGCCSLPCISNLHLVFHHGNYKCSIGFRCSAGRCFLCSVG